MVGKMNLTQWVVVGFEQYSTGSPVPPEFFFIYDDFRTGSYTDLDGQVGGLGWNINGYTASYNDEFNYTGLRGFDEISYSLDSNLNTQNGGAGWSNSYMAKSLPFGLQSQDDLTTYTSGSDVYGLNDGSNWITSYTSSLLYTGIKAYDSMDNYTSGSSLDGLNGGFGWFGLYLAKDSGSI